MEPLHIGLLLALVLFLLLGSGVWVAVSLLGVAFVAMQIFAGAPTGMVLGSSVWGGIASWSLAPLPLFIWMGEILYRSRMAEDLFSGLSPWLNWLPGRLLHVNILGSGVFAAVSGSSAATVATIGRMTIPELRRRGYPENMILGTLAGAGTLGLLIPPSIILIVYGASAELSIARLFIAGVLPGLMLIVLFMAFTALWAVWTDQQGAPEQSMSWQQRLRRTGRLLPVVGLIVAVIGTIYAGLATPSEAAAFGVAGSLLLAALTRSLSWQSFKEGLLGATRTSCMIAFILAGAAFLTVAMGYTGVPRALAGMIGELELSPVMLLLALTVFFVVIGCFLDGISVVVLTTSIILPMVEAAQIDLIWFGIYLVLVVEMSQITPPVGFNLFVLQGLTGRNIFQIAWAALPFFGVLLLGLLLICVFPEIVTYLPEQMRR